ncbi:iron hydrogenase [Patescibacteria group bacterium]
MAQARAIAKKKVETAEIAEFLALAGIAVLVPMLGNQFITGPFVNATLFIAVILLGMRYAIVLALVPSLIALGVGILPFILAPMVPIIMLSNLILVFSFNKLWEKNYWLGVGVASILKTGFLYLMSLLIIEYFITSPQASKFALLFSWPQLLTALAGGVLAYAVLKFLKRI